MTFLESRSENVIGAVIFFSYIAAALFFTGFVARDLVGLYRQSRNDGSLKDEQLAEFAKRRDRAQIFATLSVVSFAALSYQMLSFLVESYTMWARSSGSFKAENILSTSDTLSSTFGQLSGSVWIWSKQSMLFQDFAEAIVNTKARFWWTQQSLLYSMGWNIYMAIEGTRYRIPHLWAYYVLDQILPTSFTQNLFCVSLLLSPKTSLTENLKAAAPGDQFVVAFFYLLSLSIAPDFLGKTSFFVIVFAIRILLFVPYWMLRPTILQTNDTRGAKRDLYWRYRYSTSILAVGGLCLHFRQTQLVTSLRVAVEAISDNSAVATLSYDYLIGLFSLLVYFLAIKF